MNMQRSSIKYSDAPQQGWGEQGWGAGSSTYYRRGYHNRKPLHHHHDSWQFSVPPWERKFCKSVGDVPWEKLVDTKRCMYLYDNIVQWNDSANEEAFQNAKSRFWAKINGHPCDISLPDPDMYIDEIDWNSNIDPELILDLEEERKSSVEETKGDVAIFGDLFYLNQPIVCTGWGDAEEEFKRDISGDAEQCGPSGKADNKENRWGLDSDHNKGAKKDGAIVGMSLYLITTIACVNGIPVLIIFIRIWSGKELIMYVGETMMQGTELIIVIQVGTTQDIGPQD